MLAAAACSAGASSSASNSPSRPAAASATPAVPGAAPIAAVACQVFRSASAAEAKANPDGTDLAALKAYGFAVIKATKPLNDAKTNHALAFAIELAGAANIAIADGFEPNGVTAAYTMADKDVVAAGADCKALGY
jgi:hypothetical protein